MTLTALARCFTLVLVGIALISVGHAQEAVLPLDVRDHEALGRYVTDANGMSVYLFQADADASSSACVGDCTDAWPPVPVEGPLAIEADDATGTVSLQMRSDGPHQVGYGGWRLYYYAEDEEPGDVKGQGLNEQWYLVSPDGSPLDDDGAASDEAAQGSDDGDAANGTSEAEAAPEDPDLPFTAEQVERGAQAYAQNCAACHGSDLDGGFEAPQLAGPNFLNYWGGRSVWELYNVASSTMPLGNAGSLSEQQYIDIVAFVFDQNGVVGSGEPLEPTQSTLQDLDIPSTD